MDSQDAASKTSNYIKKSITLKIVSVGILILLLLIPAGMIQNLISERVLFSELIQPNLPDYNNPFTFVRPL